MAWVLFTFGLIAWNVAWVFSKCGPRMVCFFVMDGLHLDKVLFHFGAVALHQPGLF